MYELVGTIHTTMFTMPVSEAMLCTSAHLHSCLRIDIVERQEKVETYMHNYDSIEPVEKMNVVMLMACDRRPNTPVNGSTDVGNGSFAAFTMCCAESVRSTLNRNQS